MPQGQTKLERSRLTYSEDVPAKFWGDGSGAIPSEKVQGECGFPYVSKAALRASSIDRVYVNTESSEIAALARAGRRLLGRSDRRNQAQYCSP